MQVSRSAIVSWCECLALPVSRNASASECKGLRVRASRSASVSECKCFVVPLSRSALDFLRCIGNWSSESSAEVASSWGVSSIPTFCGSVAEMYTERNSSCAGSVAWRLSVQVHPASQELTRRVPIDNRSDQRIKKGNFSFYYNEDNTGGVSLLGWVKSDETLGTDVVVRSLCLGSWKRGTYRGTWMNKSIQILNSF